MRRRSGAGTWTWVPVGAPREAEGLTTSPPGEETFDGRRPRPYAALGEGFFPHGAETRKEMRPCQDPDRG
nr:MAG TPA: hypothetical protein [Caudoviricetes sp.]